MPGRHRPPGARLSRRDAAWAAVCVALAVLVGGAAYAAAIPGSYNCTRTDRADGGFDLACAVAAAPSPTGSPTPSASASASPSATASASPSPSATTPPETTPPGSPSPTPSPSPSPSLSSSPTATVGPQLDCLHQLLACGFPDASTTGVQPGITLAAVSGDVTLATAGQVYENKAVAGCITVAAANVTIRNVKVTGDCFYSIDTARGPAYDSGTTTIEHVEIACPNGRTAIGEKHVAVRWANIHGCENGFDVDGNFVIADSWIHDLLQSDSAHSDGIQAYPSATSIVVTHNVIDASGITTSAMITGVNGTQGVTLANNLLAGGAYTLYCSGNSTGWAVTGNRFVPGGYGYATDCENVPVWSGNILDATGAPVGAAA